MFGEKKKRHNPEHKKVFAPQDLRIARHNFPAVLQEKQEVKASKTAEKAGEDFDAAYQRTMRSNRLGALIGPKSLADMVVYLAGRQGRYITGQAINVCGGVNYY